MAAGAAGSTAFAGVSSLADILSGVFGYFASQETAKVAESRGRMLRLESEADIQRYQEQARNFKATQKLAYLKSGVRLSGSPLDVLESDALIAQENISAMRARARAGSLEYENAAADARLAGRSALLSGIIRGGTAMAAVAYGGRKSNTGLGSSTTGNSGGRSGGNYGDRGMRAEP